MESATAALMRTDYTACETLCLQALTQVREAKDWDTFLRILNPLQEARRWRRQKMTDEAELHLTPDEATTLLAINERLGDAILAACTHAPGTLARVDALEEKLRLLPDHEKLHQALAAAVKAVNRA